MPEFSGGRAIEDLLEVSLAAEAQGRVFYHRLSRAFAYIPEVGAFWHSLMLDESQHIAALKKIRAGLSKDQLEEEVDAASLARARAILDVLTQVRTEAVQTLDDAYELAHEYESSELNRLFAFLATHFVPATARRALLRHEIQEHQAKLTAFSARFGGRDWRRGLRVGGRNLDDTAGDRRAA